MDEYQENGDEEEEALAVKKHLHLRRMCYRGAVSQWGQNDRWDWVSPGGVRYRAPYSANRSTNQLVDNE